MTTFLRILGSESPMKDLLNSIDSIRSGKQDPKVFVVDAAGFRCIPGAPFAYWVTSEVRNIFRRLPPFDCEVESRATRCGLGTLDDFRFIRLFWETLSPEKYWKHYLNGGKFSPFYDDFSLLVHWGFSGQEIKTFVEQKVGSASRKVQGQDKYFKVGFVFPRRTKAFSPKFMPEGSIFSTAGQAGFCSRDDLYWTVALMSSQAANHLISLSQGGSSAPQFEVGLIKRLPWPQDNPFKDRLEKLAIAARSGKYKLDSVEETSLAFLLPTPIQERIDSFSRLKIECEIEAIQKEIDDIGYEVYGFSESDRRAILMSTEVNELNGQNVDGEEENDSEIDDDDDDNEPEVPVVDALLSWAVGVAFGRFDWRLATGERELPGEPDPFDPLPVNSPGMLPDGAAPFYSQAGILVDDQWHPHDLAHLVEEVLGRVDMPVPDDVHRWLQRDFFAFHLQRYSKSRRKAPIYWPLATASGSYTLWVYYPSLSSQTLYTAINDFVEPKLKEVGAGGTALRNKGSARTRDEEKQLEILQAFELELIELRDTLLGIAQGYQPNHDDGVQITAAPLWPLFRHKPWQKVLKDTLAKLEKGDYDWAHLAMSYWPARVREKCKTDKSLAIAHDLEALYVEPEAKPKKTRGKKNAQSETD